MVENRTGAGGQIALSALKTATPDGLTVAVTPMSMLGIYPNTYKFQASRVARSAKEN